MNAVWILGEQPVREMKFLHALKDTFHTHYNILISCILINYCKFYLDEEI